MALLVKNPPANAGDVRDAGSIPGSGRSPGEAHGNPLQYYCLGNPMDRGAFGATVHGVAQSQTWLKQLSTQRASQVQQRKKRVPWRYVSITRRLSVQTNEWIIFFRALNVHDSMSVNQLFITPPLVLIRISISLLSSWAREITWPCRHLSGFHWA